MTHIMSRTHSCEKALQQITYQIALMSYTLDMMGYMCEDNDYYLPTPPEDMHFLLSSSALMDRIQSSFAHFSKMQVEAHNNDNDFMQQFIGKTINRAKAFMMLDSVRAAVDYLCESDATFKAICNRGDFYATILREHKERQNYLAQRHTPQNAGLPN